MLKTHLQNVKYTNSKIHVQRVDILYKTQSDYNIFYANFPSDSQAYKSWTRAFCQLSNGSDHVRTSFAFTIFQRKNIFRFAIDFAV